uniref:Phenol hydroxylase n=1 Tax=Parastrongyloides trichosuri TaxID=131310 RepID=A0A0N5A5Q1_PARTI
RSRRRHIGDAVVAIAAPDRLGHIGAIGGHIGHGDDAAARLDARHDLTRQLALVELVRAAARHLAQAFSQQRLTEDLARAIGGSVRLQIGFARPRIGRQHPRPARRGVGLAVRQDIAFLGQLDRRRDQIGPGHGAEARVRLPHAHDRARHRDVDEARRLGAVKAAAVVQQQVRRRRRRRRAVIVDGDGLGRALGRGRHVQDHIAAAADIARARQGHGLGEGDRDGRVHRIAALAQDLDADAGGQVALADHHAAAAHHGAVDLAVIDDVAAAARGGPDLGRRLLSQDRPRQQHQSRRRNSRRRLHQTHTHGKSPPQVRASLKAVAPAMLSHRTILSRTLAIALPKTAVQGRG